MTVYWTKERLKDVVTKFISLYIMLFGFLLFLTWIYNDISVSTMILSAQLAFITDLLALCVGGLVALLEMSGDKNE